MIQLVFVFPTNREASDYLRLCIESGYMMEHDGFKPSSRLAKHLKEFAKTLGAKEIPPTEFESKAAVQLPSFEEVASSKEAFAEATKLMHHNTNPFNARALVQKHGSQTILGLCFLTLFVSWSFLRLSQAIAKYSLVVLISYC